MSETDIYTCHCGRQSREGSGLCGYHDGSRYRSAAERGQVEFVATWRANNAVEVWGPPWLCPLCNKAVQDFYGLEAHAAQIEDHQQSHGANWSLYEAAGHGAVRRELGD